MSRLMTTIAASLAFVGLQIPVAAHAEPGPAGQLTMWQNDSYEGQQESRSSYDSNLHNDSCAGCDPGPGGNFGDDMSSYVNKTGDWWVFYVDTNYEGFRFCVRPNSHDANLGNNGFSNLEDEISSVDRKGAGQPGGCDGVIGVAN